MAMDGIPLVGGGGESELPNPPFAPKIQQGVWGSLPRQWGGGWFARLQKGKRNRMHKELAEKELRFMKDLRHPNIVPRYPAPQNLIV
eukprot:6250865-Amphidinium_carterae.1